MHTCLTSKMKKKTKNGKQNMNLISKYSKYRMVWFEVICKCRPLNVRSAYAYSIYSSCLIIVNKSNVKFIKVYLTWMALISRKNRPANCLNSVFIQIVQQIEIRINHRSIVRSISREATVFEIRASNIWVSFHSCSTSWIKQQSFGKKEFTCVHILFFFFWFPFCFQLNDSLSVFHAYGIRHRKMKMKMLTDS